MLLAGGVLVMGSAPASAEVGIDWTSRSNPVDNNWRSVAYGNGTYVSVSSTGGTNKVMTSLDGITWTIGASIPNENWRTVTFGNGVFVAVANSGTGDRVMTSNDIIFEQHGDSLSAAPASGATVDKQLILYNTDARHGAGRNWGVWGGKWPESITSIDLLHYKGTGNCPALPTRCFRPAKIGEQGIGGTQFWYKYGTYGGGTWTWSSELPVTRP